jgi:hypothetical protein
MAPITKLKPDRKEIPPLDHHDIPERRAQFRRDIRREEGRNPSSIAAFRPLNRSFAGMVNTL